MLDNTLCISLTKHFPCRRDLSQGSKLRLLCCSSLYLTMRSTMPILFHHNGLYYLLLGRVVPQNPFDIHGGDTNVSDLRSPCSRLFKLYSSSDQHGGRQDRPHMLAMHAMRPSVCRILPNKHVHRTPANHAVHTDSKRRD